MTTNNNYLLGAAPSFAKAVVLPLGIMAAFSFPAILALESFGWFDGEPAWFGAMTGYAVGALGLVAGFLVSSRYT